VLCSEAFKNLLNILLVVDANDERALAGSHEVAIRSSFSKRSWSHTARSSR